MVSCIQKSWQHQNILGGEHQHGLKHSQRHVGRFGAGAAAGLWLQEDLLTPLWDPTASSSSQLLQIPLWHLLPGEGMLGLGNSSVKVRVRRIVRAFKITA